jgi:DNA-binding NarL/FixJ family response regulator
MLAELIGYNPGMSKKVLLVGHCGPDTSYLRMALRRADPKATILAAEDNAHLKRALADGVDLILVNRVLDYGFPQNGGVELMAALRREHPNLRWMLISDFADAQAAARSTGALPGFGKSNIGSDKATDALKHALHHHSEAKP